MVSGSVQDDVTILPTATHCASVFSAVVSAVASLQPCVRERELKVADKNITEYHLGWLRFRQSYTTHSSKLKGLIKSLLLWLQATQWIIVRVKVIVLYYHIMINSSSI